MNAAINLLFTNAMTDFRVGPASHVYGKAAVQPKRPEPQCPDCLEPLRICNCGMIEEIYDLPPKSPEA